MPLLTFWQVFRQVDLNILELLRRVKIGPVELDAGSTITKGTLIGGLDFFKYTRLNADLQGHQDGDKWVLEKVIYKENGQ